MANWTPRTILGPVENTSNRPTRRELVDADVTQRLVDYDAANVSSEFQIFSWGRGNFFSQNPTNHPTRPLVVPSQASHRNLVTWMFRGNLTGSGPHNAFDPDISDFRSLNLWIWATEDLSIQITRRYLGPAGTWVIQGVTTTHAVGGANPMFYESTSRLYYCPFNIATTTATSGLDASLLWRIDVLARGVGNPVEVYGLSASWVPPTSFEPA